MFFLRSLALALLVIVHPGWAEVLYDLTFDSPEHYVGQPPTVGLGPSKVWAIVDGSPRVVNNQPLLNGNCLEFEGYASREQIYLPTGAASGLIQVEFDIVTENVIGSLYGFKVFLDTPEIRTLSFHGPRQQVEAFKPRIAEATLQEFLDGRRYHVTMVADTIADRWRISIDGMSRYEAALSASIVSSIRLAMAPMDGPAPDSLLSKVYVDNFKVVTTPPNGSVALVAGVQATEIRPREVLLKANIHPQGLATNVSFRYWKEFQIGDFTPTRTLAAGSDFSTVSHLVRVAPHTTYRLTVYATNAAGTAIANSSFTTANTVPSALNVDLHSPSGTEPFTLISGAALRNDADGDAISFQLVPPGEEGYDPRVSVLQGSLTFSPDSGFDGNAEVKYGVSDGFGGIAYGVVKISNAAPVARNLTLQATLDGQAAQIAVPMPDADEDLVAITALGDAPFGQVSFQENVVTYTPGAGFLGTDEFTYTIADGRGGIATGRIRVSLDFIQQTLLHGTGSAVPGMPGAEWRTFGIPSIFAPGHAGWVGRIREGSATYDAIFSGPLGQPELRLRTGAFATNALGATMRTATFASFEQPVFAGENFAFKGKIIGRGVTPENARGIWVYDAGVGRLIARESSPAPNANGGRFRTLESVAMPDPSAVFFAATLDNGARGLWAWRKETGAQRVLADGQFINSAGNGERLGRVTSFRAISHVPGSPGHGRFDASRQAVDAFVRLQNGITTILVVDALGEITVVERTLYPPGTPRPVVKVGRSSSPGNGRKPVAVAEFTTTSPAKARHRGVIDFESGSLMALAGSLAPGPGSERFVAFKDPVAGLTATGETLAAFEATVQGAPAGTNQGIWSATTGGNLALVARKGDAAPGAEGRRFGRFKSLSVIDAQGPIFTASLAPGNETGCWATDSYGNLQLLARTGTVIDGKTIRSFDVLTAVPGSHGQRRAWAETTDGALVLFRARFTDGTQGLITISVP
jgi:hypothetical protein